MATDLLSGEAVVLSQGEAAQAIVASTAIPAAFAPVKFDGLYLADGAITSCTPVKVAVMRGATRLIVLPTGYACAREMPLQGAVANALHALTLLISRQIRSELESLDETIDFHVAPPLCPLIGSPYDFSQTAELIGRAASRTDDWLAEGGLERRVSCSARAGLRPSSPGVRAIRALLYLSRPPRMRLRTKTAGDPPKPPAVKVASNFGQWALVCGEAKTKEEKQPCSLVQALVERESRKLVFRMTVGYGPKAISC